MLFTVVGCGCIIGVVTVFVCGVVSSFIVLLVHWIQWSLHPRWHLPSLLMDRPRCYCHSCFYSRNVYPYMVIQRLRWTCMLWSYEPAHFFKHDYPMATWQMHVQGFWIFFYIQCTPDNWTVSVPNKSGPFIQMANIADFYANCLQPTILHMIHVHTCMYNN